MAIKYLPVELELILNNVFPIPFELIAQTVFPSKLIVPWNENPAELFTKVLFRIIEFGLVVMNVFQ